MIELMLRPFVIVNIPNRTSKSTCWMEHPRVPRPSSVQKSALASPPVERVYVRSCSIRVTEAVSWMRRSRSSLTSLLLLADKPLRMDTD